MHHAIMVEMPLDVLNGVEALLILATVALVGVALYHRHTGFR